jgi:nucleoside-diphosphate-sugar epimerase/dTDP-4-dehydrorhamnose 3,5-epimerase-like enzyme
MKKIVITGGLGYIGTELCKLYSGEAWFKKIVVVDNRFVSERVKQLRDWGIDFIHGSILDEKLMEDVLKDSDVIFHLAGITDVAYTKTESNSEKDLEINNVGIHGTRNIIKYSNDNTKIIFPSTHVVYEGFSETKFEIDESEDPKPVLTYSKGKVQSEKDLFYSNKNFVILRLGSVYGYSSDTMRINIMPNLFSKITSQNGTIKLFSGGVQYKSLVSIQDVVRAMKYVCENDFTREIFHLSNESKTIKEVSDICKKINPLVNIIETEDEIPNMGYTISNKKIKLSGFKFLYDLESSMFEMISNWSPKNINPNFEFKIKGQKEFVDERGKISNFELTEPINLIGYIESKSGTVRANHYHPIQEQKCLLIKGKYISVTKDLSNNSSVIETRIINEGEIAVIKPNVAHTMVFLEDSIFLNLVRGEREHENYGITHTIPYVLVDSNFKEKLLKNYSHICRSCEGKNLEDVVSLGLSPLANNLLNSEDENYEKFPLEMKYCSDCHNCQLSYVVEPEKMFDNYLYVSSTAKSFREHFIDSANKYISEFGLNENDLVVDIGSNDGVFLKPLKEKGIKILGVEPAKNISKIANENGIKTINGYLNESITLNIIKEHGNAKLVTAFNVFAHSDELKKMANLCFQMMREDGVFIIEVQYLLDTIKDLTFDNIYHEHVNYWSVTSLNSFFSSLGFFISKVEHVNTHGGSIRVYVKKQNVDIDESVNLFLQNEINLGLTSLKTFEEFKSDIYELKKNICKNISKLKNKGLKLSCYGSPAKATTSLNFYGITNKEIDYTIEDNHMKHGKIIPGTNIPIKSKEYCLEHLPNIIIVLAWNFYEDIKKNNKDLSDKGVKFISIKELEKNNFEL